jgi:methylthioribulose 1-phosphate dehydratase / enolase-phosphatase E1
MGTSSANAPNSIPYQCDNSTSVHEGMERNRKLLLLGGDVQVGDLRPYLMGFFDTTSGPKREKSSYQNIAQALGVDVAEEILFATDVAEEAKAAIAAGWQCVLFRRPGNAELPKDHGLRVVETMDELLAAQ